MAMLAWLTRVADAVVTKLLVDECRAYFPGINRQLLTYSVSRLPIELRERYSIEWEAYLNDIPGDLTKLLHAVGLLRASSGICKELTGAGWLAESVVWRMIDIAYSSVLLLLLAPLLLVVSILVLICCGHSVFEWTSQPSRNRQFRLLRFRTRKEPHNGRRCDPVWESFRREDMTPFGRILNNLSLDYLPMLLNILRGDMTLIGPPIFHSRYKRTWNGAVWAEIATVKPGIIHPTILYAKDSSASEYVRSQVEYARKKCLAVDLKILILHIKLLPSALFHVAGFRQE